MSNSADKKPASIKVKLIAILVIATTSVIATWLLSDFAFNRLFVSVEQLTRPNEKIRLINNISYLFTRINQIERQQFINYKPAEISKLGPVSQDLMQSLDSLETLCSDKPIYISRIDSMRSIIDNYDHILTQYLGLYTEITNPQKFSKEYSELNELVALISQEIDTNVVTTETKLITTTTIPGEEEADTRKKRSFLQRLFGKKEEEEKPADTLHKTAESKIIEEKQNVRVDTISRANRTEITENIEMFIDSLDRSYRGQLNQLYAAEQNLINYSELTTAQFYRMLRDFEVDELNEAEQTSTTLATELLSTIKRIIFILVIFVIIIGILSFLIFIDVNRNNNLRLQLQLAKEKAEQLSRVKQRFLSNMSHEIRTPLQSILGFAEQIRKKQLTKDESVEIIYKSAAHLHQIVNEVLDYSKLISGKYELVNQPFRIHDLLKEVMDSMRTQAEQKNLRFNFINTADPDLTLHGDAFRLKQILYNLIGNAIKFTDEGEVSFSFDYTAENKVYQCRFTTKDTGIGIAAEHLERIFNEFEQANPVSGTGLGLSITKSLIDLMNGTLKVESEQGKGSEFVVNLAFPLAEKKPSKTTVNELPLKNSLYGKVFVVDDDPYILKLIDDILTENAIEHHCMQDARDLLKMEIDDNSLVLMDLNMPEMHGFELCAQLRGKACKQLKIVALTAHVLPDEKDNIRDHGFDDLLAKPFVEADLLQLIYKYLVDQDFDRKLIEKSPMGKMAMGDASLLNQQLKHFVTETDKDILLLEKAFKQQDSAGVTELAHRLAGRTAQIGATEVSQKLRTLEKVLRSNQALLIEEDETIEKILVDLAHLVRSVLNQTY
ncbi:MAG: ATP-binding protein [Bacteroidales bacterium]|nr:ATP-binding protein [Bacteroidales bacterium]